MNAELKVRCSHTEKLLWEQAAVASGSTLSWWVRATLKAEAESIVEQEPPAELETSVDASPVAEAAVTATKPPSRSPSVPRDRPGNPNVSGAAGYVQDLAPNPETRAAADRAFANLPSGCPAYVPPTYK